MDSKFNVGDRINFNNGKQLYTGTIKKSHPKLNVFSVKWDHYSKVVINFVNKPGFSTNQQFKNQQLIKEFLGVEE